MSKPNMRRSAGAPVGAQIALTLLFALLTPLVNAATGLAVVCPDAAYAGKSADAVCPKQVFAAPGPTTLVRAGGTWQPYAKVAAGTTIEICTADITPGRLVYSGAGCSSDLWGAIRWQPKTGPVTANARKWHPGHYVRTGDLAFNSNDALRFYNYDRIKNEPFFLGGAMGVSWGILEPKKGVYDFSLIDKDLAYLKAMNKRLIIEIWYANYWHQVPSRPQGNPNRYLPDYLFDEGLVTAWPNAGYIATLQKPAAMDRLIELAKAICARYDGEPLVEQIIMGETAGNSAYEFKRLIPAMGTACPHTTTILQMNFVDTPQLARDLVDLSRQHGTGVGGPDILPPRPISPYGEDHASLVLRAAGIYRDGDWSGDFGSTDYRGVIPISYQFQALYKLPPSVLMPYASDTLKATHIQWTATDGMEANLNWSTGVLATIKAWNGKVASACPSSYQNRCTN